MESRASDLKGGTKAPGSPRRRTGGGVDLLIPVLSLLVEMGFCGRGRQEVSALTQWSSNLPVAIAGARERAGFMEQPV